MMKFETYIFLFTNNAKFLDDFQKDGYEENNRIQN